MKQESEHHTLLTTAEHHLDRARESETGHELLSSSQWGRLTGASQLHLGHYRSAKTTLEEALTRRGSKKSRAIMLGNISLACIRMKEPDEAAVALHRAIDVAEETWGGGGLNTVFTAGHELRPFSSNKLVADVRERLFDLISG